MSDLCLPNCPFMDKDRVECWQGSSGIGIPLKEVVYGNEPSFQRHPKCKISKREVIQARAKKILREMEAAAKPVEIPAIWPSGRRMTDYERRILESWEKVDRPIILKNRIEAEREEDEGDETTSAD